MRYSCTIEHYEAHIALHKAWTDAVGTEGYVKSSWMELARALHCRCRGGCLASPPPLARTDQLNRSEP